MVKALVAGRKTQTRRILNIPVQLDTSQAWADPGLGAGGYLKAPTKEFLADDEVIKRVYPRFEVGDRLWVRETWAVGKCADGLKPSYLSPGCWKHDNGGCWYRADDAQPATPISPRGNWRPSLFMPRWASRLTLTATDVRVQRLQEISEEDALAEGVKKVRDHCYVVEGFGYDLSGLCHSSPTTAYAILWDGINQKAGKRWDDNPWIVACTFRVELRNIDRVPVKSAEAATA